MITLEYLRSFRIGGYAVFDFAVSFLAVYLLSPLLSKLCRKFNVEISRKSWLLFTIPLSILIHILVGTITPMTANFISFTDNFLLKFFVIILLIFGIKDIKKIK